MSAATAEKRLRTDLAAAYRLTAHYGWDDQLTTHITARLPGPEQHFLINPFGFMFDEVTASSLVKIDHTGSVVDADSEHSVNKAGFTIHSAIHAARDDAKCIMHCHTVAGVAVGAQQQGLLALSGHAMTLYGRIGYHDYEGVVLECDEQERIVENLANNLVLMMRNHGTLCVAPSIAEMFFRMYYLERACQMQVAALSCGRQLTLAPDATGARVQEQMRAGFSDLAEMTWAALLRMLDRKDPSYRD